MQRMEFEQIQHTSKAAVMMLKKKQTNKKPTAQGQEPSSLCSNTLTILPGTRYYTTLT